MNRVASRKSSLRKHHWKGFWSKKKRENMLCETLFRQSVVNHVASRKSSDVWQAYRYRSSGQGWRVRYRLYSASPLSGTFTLTTCFKAWWKSRGKMSYYPNFRCLKLSTRLCNFWDSERDLLKSIHSHEDTNKCWVLHQAGGALRVWRFVFSTFCATLEGAYRDLNVVTGG